jgi:hypothetical protein
MRFYILMFACFVSCAEQKTQTNNLQAVKDILIRERTAHLTKNVSMIIGDDTVINVNKGIVNYGTPESGRQRFTKYFSSVDFVKWDDVAPPIFIFSGDSTLAVVHVQKQVILKEPGGIETDTTDFAWTAVYQKINKKWGMVSVTSTNK